ncbi:hypothetical protein [Saccharopolyspora aridisoli]|uniref:hypothetical protein n=1 Tax=Saccharopolyspora aridisoli TaxID=2530385 RepID=UPI0014042AA4|nr:hypothetical protein [Saccharopolyspora aridisoli]
MTSSVDRALEAYYGPVETSYTTGNSYYPGYYPYAYDRSPQERTSLVSVYGQGSAEVRAFDAGIAEVNYWHTSGGAYTYNTMINNYANEVSSICSAYYGD